MLLRVNGLCLKGLNRLAFDKTIATGNKELEERATQKSTKKDNEYPVFFGMSIVRTAKRFEMNQEKHIERITTMIDCDQDEFRNLVGKIIYIAQRNRPDFS